MVEPYLNAPSKENTMSRYYEGGLPRSNYHEALSDVAFGENNHIKQVFIDRSNEYGARVIINCWSEQDADGPDNLPDASHWYSIRDHKGDVLVAELTPPADVEIAAWDMVWE